MNFGNVVLPWTKHVRTGRDLVRRAFETANQVGDLVFAAFCCHHINTNLLAAGDPLDEVQAEAEYGLAFAQKMRFGLGVDFVAVQLALVRTLRGSTPLFGCFDDEQFDELWIERRFSENPNLAIAECWYWIRKLQARFFAGDHAAALASAEKAQRLLWTSPSLFDTAEYHFYGALSRAASCESASAGERRQHVEALAVHHRQLEIWAANCPENFENRAALVAAEIARIEGGRALDAERLYERAISSARANGFVHNEALAYELAARFYAARGFEEFARVYMRKARDGYVAWGADGKVRQLDEIYPYRREEERAPGPTGTIGTSVEHLDLGTVIKVSQAISGEIVLEMLIDTLMHTAIEQAGAERGLLIIPRGAELRIEAEATTEGDTVVVRLRDQPVTAATLPESVLHYVLRAREGVIIDDAARSEFAADPYLGQRQARSVLCLPLITQAKLIGVLYLENTLTPRVFAPARSAVLKLLASQAAIALENARLYRDLEQREAKIRRLVDANIIGIFIWDLEGRTIEANDTFLRMIGCDQEDLVSGRAGWTELTPAEWRHVDERAIEQMKMTGTSQPFEKEFYRKDGSRVPVLVGAAGFNEQRDQGVAFVLDLTERKRAEAEARESERRIREMQMGVAHANRVATMGQLTASIAHEVNQPISGAVTNAEAALRWLGARPPDLEEVRQALGRIVTDTKRAGDVVGRIREIVKKAPPRKDGVDMNEATREVVELTRGEAAKNGAAVQLALGEGLPLVEGDRVQLQQVVLNLIVNAVQAMGAVEEGPRELFISTAQAEPNGVVVAVKDSGPGLAPESREQIFAPFYTSKPDGLGMGLSICRSIIEAHGGRLWVTANQPRGAIFRFTVPTDPGSAS